jgi:glutamyl-tRNA synthetase
MKFTRGDAAVTYDKLWYLQRAHATRFAMSEAKDHEAKLSLMTKPILHVLKEGDWVNRKNLVLGRHEAESYVVKLLKLDSRNYTTAPAFVDRNRYFFERPDRGALISYLSRAVQNPVPKPSSLIPSTEAVSQVSSSLELIPAEAWTIETIRDSIETAIAQIVDDSMKKFQDDVPDLVQAKKAAHKSLAKSIHRYIRWVIAAGSQGPEGAPTMQILGKDETLARFAQAAKILMTLPTGKLKGLFVL